MDTINRRDMCLALSALALIGVASEAEASQLPNVMAVPAPPGSAGDPILSKPRVFRFSDLPVVKTANGAARAVIRGVLPTGEAIELHETTLLPGRMPHPPHRHRHSELMMVREGTLEFESGGHSERVGPGGVMFAASNILHGLKNVGSAPANYFVIAIGREASTENA